MGLQQTLPEMGCLPFTQYTCSPSTKQTVGGAGSATRSRVRDVKRIDFLDLFLDPEALWCLDGIRVKSDDRIDDQLSVEGITRNLSSPEGTGSRSAPNVTMGIIDRSMARTTKALLIGEPVRGTSQMAAD
jgi:hypothetical protein